MKHITKITGCRGFPQNLVYAYNFVKPKTFHSVLTTTPQYRGRIILESGLQKAIKTASKRAGIHKHVTSHTFKHSFATHMLEDGVNIRVVQDLMGHADVKTTEIYTHVMEKDINAVVSPLDTLQKLDGA
ncbi:MAG: tyrosine-type recombinase/integrase [Desulfobacteraceae bacterium]|nr:tyrosine-type recombinase/integrase [Desulfobacteraceae bacterium]